MYLKTFVCLFVLFFFSHKIDFHSLSFLYYTISLLLFLVQNKEQNCDLGVYLSLAISLPQKNINLNLPEVPPAPVEPATPGTITLPLALTHSLPLLICRRESLLGRRRGSDSFRLQLGRTGLGPSAAAVRDQFRAQIAVAPGLAPGAAEQAPRQLVLDALPNGRRLAWTALAARAAVVGAGRRGRGGGGGRSGRGCSPVPPAPGRSSEAGGERRCGRGRRSHLRHHHRSQSHGRCCGR